MGNTVTLCPCNHSSKLYIHAIYFIPCIVHLPLYGGLCTDHHHQQSGSCFGRFLCLCSRYHSFGFSLGLPAGDQEWDMSFLKNQTRRSEVFRDPALSQAKASFPTANAMVRTNTRETFYRLSANKVEELGFANRAGGPIPGFNQPTVYSKPVTVFNTPTTFGSNLSSKTDVTIPFPASFVPDSLLSQIPGPIKPDSFRIRLTTQVDRLSDAWGKVKLPLKSWDVIREKVTTNTTFAIEARLGLLGWQDITAFAGAF